MNVILIISDTFRYDNLFERASMPVRTPHLDRFAERTGFHKVLGNHDADLCAWNG